MEHVASRAEAPSPAQPAATSASEGHMKIADMNWMQVEATLEHDDRCVLPLGSVEQHAYLSLAVDMVLAERVALDAAGPLGVPVFPALPYGLAPYFSAYPGSVTLRVDTYARVVRDLLDSLRRSGFRRVLLVNGHGGNQPAGALAGEYVLDHPEMRVKIHDWWAAPRTMAAVLAIDPVASHASWMENFPWTRLEGVAMPQAPKASVDTSLFKALPPGEARRLLEDGSFGGAYERPEDDMLRVWLTAVEETRAVLEGPWDA
jgi:creatinine amidohydrolase